MNLPFPPKKGHPKYALLISSLLLTGTAMAQDTAPAAPDQPRNIIKIAPLGWIHGHMPFTVESRLGYERVLSRRSSVGAAASYLGTNYVFNFVGSLALSAAFSQALTLHGHPTLTWVATTIRTQGARYQLQYRYYLGQKGYAPNGFYLSPQASYTKVAYTVGIDDTDIKFGLKSVNRNANLLVGFQHVLGRHFTFDVFTGYGYRKTTTGLYGANDNYLEPAPDVVGHKLNSGLNLGWAF